MFALMVNSFIFVICAILYSSALPRYRIDQLLSLNWNLSVFIFLGYYFIFISLLLLFL